MNITASVSSKISETELVEFLTAYASANDFPFALWRLPESNSKHLLISHRFQGLSHEAIIEDLRAGFIFSPFDRTKESIFLPGNFLFVFEDGKLKEANDPLTISSHAWLEREYSAENKQPKLRIKNRLSTQGQDADESFLTLVNKCIDEIERGTFEKIVPSRTKTIDLPVDFDVLTSFQKLCSKYRQALVSFVNIPEVGTWMGATPEVLVTVEDKNIFKTVALAGTKSYSEGANLKSIAWTQKEIEEQALVERYVISCFKKIRLREYDEHGPKTIVAGNLIHLRTDFTVDMKATGFPQLGSIMLQLLHPTSAVCGMPLDAALKFLKSNEGYDRSFYAGFLGPINVNNNINIFVNLRCMQIGDKQATLYAGAGVTVDSIPEEEYDETEMKFNTLRNVIF
jgi:isochorismate synthase